MKQVNIAGMIDFPIFYQGIKFHCREIEQVKFMGNYDEVNIKELLKAEKIDLLFIKKNSDPANENKQKESIRLCKKMGCHPVIFLNSAEENIVRKYFEEGYKGILSTNVDAYELELAIKTIVKGGFYVSQELSSSLFDAIVNPEELQKRKTLSERHLTRRELEVMQLIYREMTNQQIAKRLGISPRTVEVHRLNIIRKLGVKNSIGIVKFAIQNEMVVQ